MNNTRITPNCLLFIWYVELPDYTENPYFIFVTKDSLLNATGSTCKEEYGVMYMWLNKIKQYKHKH